MSYKFIDLFAGIGGFRQGFERMGFECVFSSESDEHARDVYKCNFGETPFGDITKVRVEDIPEFDILLAGFPCQPFSIAGEKKGFNDTRGTLFFDIARIVEYHKPRVVVLENVKHFKNHDHGRTLEVVLQTLNDLGYATNWKLLNAKDFGVPQNRERTIIVGSKDGIELDFSRFEAKEDIILKDILENDNEEYEFLEESEFTLIENPKKQLSGLIFCGYRNKNIRTKGIRENTEHLSRVHKQPNRIYSSEGTHPTLSSQESSGRFFIYHNNKVRKLTLLECFRLMGFSDDFKRVGARSKLYNRIGNSIVIPMVEEISRQVKDQLFNNEFKYIPKPKQLSIFESVIEKNNISKNEPVTYAEQYISQAHEIHMKKSDKEIDQMVYELYGLTEDEIRIVEEG
ncbi:MAG: DNA (cytosine-5-)-methyltransferase [Chlorobi bacterium]|nr:DNA (cytosine-5-)-methyltransferase [Chlorobiota bacterium]